MFPVVADFDSGGQLLRLRIDLGSDETINVMRELGIA
jgi:hypothetical protein